MKLRPEEITSILRQRIEEFDLETNLAEVGAVLQLGDGIARVHGLENCVALELLELDHGVVGIAFNLEEDNVGVALFGAWDKIKEGDSVRRTGDVETGARSRRDDLDVRAVDRERRVLRRLLDATSEPVEPLARGRAADP